MLDTAYVMDKKNYSHCPLKKRPVQVVDYIPEEPENLSTKPEDLSKTGQVSSSSHPSPSVSPSENISPPPSYYNYPSMALSNSPSSSPSPPVYYPRAKCQSTSFYPPMKTDSSLAYHHPASLSPDYAPQTWHRSVAPTAYPYGFLPYGYQHHEFALGSRSPYSDSSLSPPHQPVHPLVPLAIRPTVYSDQSSLSPNSSTASPPPQIVGVPEDLSEKRRQGNRHQCPDCGKSYSTFSGLSKHRQFHCAAGEGPKKSFSCKYCEKIYVSLGALKMHIRTHTLPCKCDICGKAFSRPWLLQGHIRTHTGEKPFSCTHCNRAFADRSNLRAHLQTHSDVKKYSCRTCNKTFSRMSLLTKHAEGGCMGNTNLMHIKSEKLY
ncbi:hypothetical protein WA026_020288 [Henosepilachna vigintioctopunctata]|uniref:C2H2-type domain-containing protein n=1 Tax=Henosepilachna vigintioctopunctata TaxID=420089 RepID=A0AAW1TRG6_9CUCU